MVRSFHTRSRVAAFVAIGALAFPAIARADETCTEQSGEPTPAGATPAEKPSLVPETAAAAGSAPSLDSSGPAAPINFGGARDVRSTDIVLSVSPKLPDGTKPSDFTVEMPRRFIRSGDLSPTVHLPEPLFTPPRILQGGKLVSFRLCVDGQDIKAGSYVGQVIVNGPPGVESLLPLR